jgi:hypothetical protein
MGYELHEIKQLQVFGHEQEMIAHRDEIQRLPSEIAILKPILVTLAECLCLMLDGWNNMR